MITALIGPITNVITGMMKNSSEKSQAKQKLAVAKIEAQVSRVQQDGDWEAKAWTIFFIALIAACMWPDAQPYIKQGFTVLKEDCPEFISWGILASIGASFGLKSIGAFKK